MLTFWNLANLVKDKEISGKYAERAESSMVKGYDLIGDSYLPSRGFFLFDLIQQFVNYDKIGRIKKIQIGFYENKLYKYLAIKIPYSDKDKNQMRAWPLVLPVNRAYKVLNFLRGNNLKVRFELNDSVWSEKQKIIYLPLGPHLNTRNLTDICDLVIKSYR